MVFNLDSVRCAFNTLSGFIHEEWYFSQEKFHKKTYKKFITYTRLQEECREKNEREKRHTRLQLIKIKERYCHKIIRRALNQKAHLCSD